MRRLSTIFFHNRNPRQPGWYIPWLFVLGFLVVVTANGFLIHFSLKSWPGLTTEHAFEEGVTYNRTLAAARSQAEREWRVVVQFVDSGKRRGTIEVSLRDRQGRPLTGASVTATFIRPTSPGHDQTINLVEHDGGRYDGGVVMTLPGIWDVRVVVAHPDGEYQKIERIGIKE
ncbi:Nitrogen fixation protein FixH [Azospirillaceae bacterium]